ncbi:MAG: 2-hydroxyacyl-CoA dehydratase [Acidobacteria bacterium]|nr:2-hydroxyacyl-CoA dehydratase [Acidobacteriota bacterium]
MAIKLFQGWQGKSLEQILTLCRDLLEDTNFPTVHQWREAGGKVVGHFQVYFPEEIVHAAGALPFKLRGAPVDLRHADSHFGSYLCSIVKTTLELALGGRVKLDMFVTHPICDAARNLAGVWGRNFRFPCQILYLPQNPNSRHSVSYLRDEYDRLRRTVEEVTGRPVTDESLQSSLGVFNENRALLRQLYAIKRERPWLIATDEAYVLVALGGLLPREEHNELLRAVLPLVETRPSKRQDKIRVIFEGGFCEQPPLDLIRVISQSCYVVDDDLLIGLRWILDDVPREGDPLRNLAHAYVEKSSYSPVQHDVRKPKEKMLLERLRSSGATAAIIGAAKMCEPGLEEQVTYARTLDREGIPYFVTEFEEGMTSFDNLEIQLETFVESILF